MKRFCRFNLVGLLGAGLQLFLLHFLAKFFPGSAVAVAAIAVEITVLHNFVWHERCTWRDRTPAGTSQSVVRLLRFHAGNGLVSLVGNTAFMYWLVDRLQAPLLPSALGAIAFCAVVNYLLADRWVYAPARTLH